MTIGDTGYKGQSQFSRAAKIDDSVIIQLAYAFGQGFPLPQAMALTGLSRKTIRHYYQAMRARLMQPKFNRWHGVLALLPTITDPQTTLLVKSTFFDLMAECYASHKCFENYQSGKRKTRQCRACPLNGKFKNALTLAEAYTVIDEVRGFYKNIGIRREADHDPVSLFRMRLMHTSTVIIVQQNSKRLENGLLDPQDQTFLSLGMLLDIMLEDLADNPL